MPRWMVIGVAPGMVAPLAVALSVACCTPPTAPRRTVPVRPRPLIARVPMNGPARLCTTRPDKVKPAMVSLRMSSVSGPAPVRTVRSAVNGTILRLAAGADRIAARHRANVGIDTGQADAEAGPGGAQADIGSAGGTGNLDGKRAILRRDPGCAQIDAAARRIEGAAAGADPELGRRDTQIGDPDQAGRIDVDVGPDNRIAAKEIPRGRIVDPARAHGDAAAEAEASTLRDHVEIRVDIDQADTLTR
jgi:hypothetical protein